VSCKLILREYDTRKPDESSKVTRGNQLLAENQNKWAKNEQKIKSLLGNYNYD